MAVEVALHPFFSPEGKTIKMTVEGNSVRDCLREVARVYPEAVEKMFGRNGKLRDDIEVFVNDKSSYPLELDHPVKDGDKISVIVFLGGG